MTRLSLIIILALGLGCQNKKGDVIANLTNNTYKYWDVVEMHNFYSKSKSRVYPVYCYYFNLNGEFGFYKYENEKRKIYDSGDVQSPDSWQYSSDTTILIGGVKLAIGKLTEDTLILFYPNTNKIILAKSEN